MGRIFLSALAASLVFALLAGGALAQTEAVRVSVDCELASESITVFNDMNGPITVSSITSLVNPRPNEEPFTRNDAVPAGGSVTYSLGTATPAMGAIKLSGNSILRDDAPGEGIRVETSAGVVEALCSAGLGSLIEDGTGTVQNVPTLMPTTTPVAPVATEPGVAAVVGTGGDLIPVPAVAATPGPPFVGVAPAKAPGQLPGKAGAAPGQLPVGSAAATRVIEFQPAAVMGDPIAGSCWTGSLASSQPDAYRCASGNEIHDPCFARPNGQAVICVQSPLDEAGVLMNLTEPLPAVDPAVERHPWYLQLADGSVCNFATGGSAGFGGERINYYCSDRTQLLGFPDMSGRVWEVHKVVLASDLRSLETSEWVPVTTAWY